MKKEYIILVLIIILSTVCTASSNSASINIGLTIQGVNETQTSDGEKTPDGASFTFMPTDPSIHEEQDYHLRVITNNDFALEYFWADFETVDPRIVAYLNIDEDKYSSNFKGSDNFDQFLLKKLTIGKNVGYNSLDNTIRKSRVKLDSGELDLNPNDPLDFKIIYDPTILKGSYVEGETGENILNVIVTFFPNKE